MSTQKVDHFIKDNLVQWMDKLVQDDKFESRDSVVNYCIQTLKKNDPNHSKE